jgi:hypothetical protein
VTRATEPTQSDVLRERASQVPWRRAFGNAIRGLAGHGPMERPDRLEGALYAHLIAGGATVAGDHGALLDQVEALLSDRAGNAFTAAPHERALAAALVLRDRPVADVVAAVVPPGALVDEQASDAASAAVYALTVRRFIDGERNHGAAVSQARRQAISTAAEPVRAALHAPDPPPFGVAWQAFARAREADDALAAATSLASGDAAAASIVGGLAGARWGSSRLSGQRGRTRTAGERARRVADRLVETDDPGVDASGWQTSTSVPLVVHGIDLADTKPAIAGSIGITPLPGRRYVAYHTGAHWRDLDTDAGRLRGLGIDLLLLLVEDRELDRCRVTDIETVLRDHDIGLVRHPIRDPLVPRDHAGFKASVAEVLEAARRGRGVAVACRGGFDRAGMTAACLLREAGLDATTAIDRVQRARPGALALPDQQAYVRAWPSR